MSVGNTGSRLIGNTEFYGGLSTDVKIGIENSYADAECLDVRKSPSQMTVLPKAKSITASETNPIVAMTQDSYGVIYGIRGDGKLYTVANDNSALNVLNSATPFDSGMGLEYYTTDDSLYFTSKDYRFGSYGQINSVPAGESTTRTTFTTMDDNGR